MNDLSIFLVSPPPLGEFRTEYVNPAFSALFVDAIGQSFTDLHPALCAMNSDLLFQYFVLLCRP